MPLSREKIISKLKNNAVVHTYDSIDSTNNEAKRRAQDDSGVHIYATTYQTAGRGRRGHDFYSPKDTGLYMTVALPYKEISDCIQRVTCAAAVAVCEAVEALSDIKPKIKWVNDIFADGRKAAGILTELICVHDNLPSAVIVGIGLNLKTENFPGELAYTAGSLGDIDPDELCAAISDNLTDLCSDLSNNSIIEKYSTRSLCTGQQVTFIRNGIEVTAEAVGIDSDGGLIVDTGGERMTLNSGEISIRIDRR